MKTQCHKKDGNEFRSNQQAVATWGSVALSEFPKIDPLPVASLPDEYATLGVSRKRKMLNATEPGGGLDLGKFQKVLASDFPANVFVIAIGHLALGEESKESPQG